MGDTYAQAQKVITELAARDFTKHVLTVEGPGEWRCGEPDTVIMSFRILCRPGMVVVWGDLGEWVLRHSDRDSLGWLRGAVRSPDYVLQKVKAGERLRFYAADAMASLDDPETIESWGADVVEKIREALPVVEDLTQERWLDACYNAPLDDPPREEYPTESALWLIELLRKFVALEAKAAEGTTR
ncbi:MAG TPA: hypothetical protein VN436_13445 [Holophaga sp.]|nr:hypothetical protein [Holophaga sp.]